MYGKSIYGLERYAYDREQEELSEEYFVELTHYVPPFFTEIKEFVEIYRSQGYALGKQQHDLSDMLAQGMVTTATWGLNRWEKVYGIVTNMSLSYEQRREIIAAKMRGQGTTTKQMIRDTAAAFSGGDVQVIEDNENSRFIVRFVGTKGIPHNMQAFVNALDEIKPAHLAWKFEYTYTMWNTLGMFTWGNLADKTWDGIRIMREVEYNDETWKSMGLYTWDMSLWKNWDEI